MLLERTYSKKARNTFIKGSLESLENVSNNPVGDYDSFKSTLKRSRSLAVSRENLFTSFDIPSANNSRRAQLIPRAKLIDRNTLKERCTLKDRNNLEILANSDRHNPLRRSISSDCASPSINYERHWNSLTDNENSVPSDNAADSDSLEAKYYKDPNTHFGLSLPNYYPDSRCDTDVSLTDLSVANEEFQTKENLSTNNLFYPSDNILYQENISFGKGFLEEKYAYNKPRSLRQYTPFFYEEKPNSLPNYPVKFTDPDQTESNNIYDTVEKIETPEGDPQRNHEPSESSSDDVANCQTPESHHDSCFDTNPIYDEIPINPPIPTEKIDDACDDCTTTLTADEVKDQQESSNDDDKRHSHNYLKEFLETQKGSSKPLQNFLSKKISRAFRDAKKPETNLTANRYHSLPDLAIGKNLRQSEKIDRKLRRASNNNRFIVNIGNHFDVTAETNIPVDFEVKIRKIPKIRRSKSHKTKENNTNEFINAVKNLKDTLNTLDENHNIVNTKKPYVIEAKTKKNKIKHKVLPKIKEVAELIENMDSPTSKELQVKLDTMKNYWGKMTDTEKCKIVDVQPKSELSINEGIVQATKQIFESKNVTCKSPVTNGEDSPNSFESLNPNIVELIEKEKPTKVVRHIEPEFDHIRYRVMKSDLFQKNIFANCRKESQFDGLMQYLQDYSFQELLIDNNIVIIEPIRSNVPYDGSKNKTSCNITSFLHKTQNGRGNDKNPSGLPKRFFYHPIRVNREMNENELPNPDTVKLVRQMFESGLKKSQSLEKISKVRTVRYQAIDPDKDVCSASTSQESENNSDAELCCEQQYVSEDVLQKIRKCGTSITYYGGKVLNKDKSVDPMTQNIMDEIESEKQRECSCEHHNESYNGIKFRLLKSNSCSSRLELVGTEHVKEEKQKYLMDHKNRENQRKNSILNEEEEETKDIDVESTPKIMQLCNNTNEEKLNKTSKQKANYNFHNYEKLKASNKKGNDMEFEPYEIAGN